MVSAASPSPRAASSRFCAPGQTLDASVSDRIRFCRRAGRSEAAAPSAVADSFGPAASGFSAGQR